MRFSKQIQTILRNSKAASTGEIGLVAGLIAIVVIGTISLMGDRVDELFLGTGNQIEEAIGFEDFTFTDVTHAALNSPITATPITIGVMPADTPVQLISAPENTFLILNNAPAGQSTKINKGDTLSISMMSANTPDTSESIVIRAGERYQTTWTVTTGSTTPNNLTFDEIQQAQPNSEIISALYIPEGITIDSPISIQGDATAQYRLDGGTWTQEDGTLSVGQSVELKLTSGENDGTRSEASLTIGEASAIWSVTTIDQIVAGISIPEQRDLIPNQYVETEEILPTDFDQPLELSLQAPENIIAELSLNNGPWVTGPLTLAPDDFFKARVQTPNSEETATEILLSLGETDIPWSVVTGNSTPLQFFINPVFNAPAHEIVTTSGVGFRPSNFTIPTNITIDNRNNAEFSIDFDDWTSEPQTLNPGSFVRVRLQTGDGDGSAYQTTLTIGGVTGTWEVTTADVVPDPFLFEDIGGQEPGLEATSAPVMIMGTTAPAQVTATGGEVSVDNGASFSTSAIVPVAGSIIARVVTPELGIIPDFATVTIDINGVSDDFTATNKGTNSQPTEASITLTNLANVEPNVEIVSEELSPSGYDAPTTLSVSGTGSPVFSISGGAWITNGTIYPGQKVRFKVTTADYSNSISVNYTVGEIDKVWTVSSRVYDATPAPFNFTDLTLQKGNTEINSEAIILKDYLDPVPVSISNGLLQINGGAWVSSGTLQVGDKLKVKLTTGPQDGGTNSATISAGGVNTTWNITRVDTMPVVPWSESQLTGKTNYTTTGCYLLPAEILTGIDTAPTILPSTPLNGTKMRACYQVDNGWRSEGATVPIGSTLRIGIDAKSSDLGAVGEVIVNIGGTEMLMRLAIRTTDPVPYRAFQVEDVADAPVNQLITSNIIRLRNNPSPSFVWSNNSAVEFSLNGSGSWAQTITVPSEGSFKARLQAPASLGQTATATIYAGSSDKKSYKYDVWEISTEEIDITPDPNPASIKEITGDKVGIRTSHCYVPTGYNSCTSFTLNGKSDIWLHSSHTAILNTKTSGTICPGNKICHMITGPTRPGDTVGGTVDINGVTFGPFSYTLDPAIETTVSNFNFIDVPQAEPSQEYLSNTISVNGPKTEVPFTVTGDGEARVGSGSWTKSGYVSPGKNMQLRVTSAGEEGGIRQTTLTLGYSGDQTSSSWTVTTPDTIPDSFNFTAYPNMEPNTFLPSSKVTVSGVLADISASVSGGATMTVNGGAFVTTATVSPGDQIQLWLTTGNYGASHSPTLNLAGVTAAWSVTVRAKDTQPAPFSFTSKSNQNGASLVESNRVQILGFADATSISISGQGNPEYSIQGGTWTNTAGTILPGQRVALRLTTGAETGESRTAQLSIGGVNGSFVVTTKDTTPNSFSIPAISNATVNQLTTSSEVLISGFDSPITIAVSGEGDPNIEVNNSGNLVKSTTLSPEDRIKVHLTAPNNLGQTHTATISANGVTATWSVTSSVGN